MLAAGEPVPDNGGTEEEEEEVQNGNQNSEQGETEQETNEDPNGENEEENAGSGNNVNHQNSEQNESGNQESQDGENDENPPGLVVVVEEADEEEEERRRIAAEKGKQPMPDQGVLSITELDDDDIDYHLDLAILKSMCDYKCSTPKHPSYNKRLLYIKNSIPDSEISREDLEEKIISLEKSFNDIRKQHGDDPQMARPINREIFDLSMIVWGRR